MTSDNVFSSIIDWKKPTGFLSRIKNALKIGSKWNNIELRYFEDIVGAALNDKNLKGDSLIVKCKFHSNLQRFDIEIIDNYSLLSQLDSFRHNDIAGFIEHVIIENKLQNQNLYLACQIYGDFWVLDKTYESWRKIK